MTGRQAPPGEDYYALLGVPPGASQGAIRAAFRELAKRLHPDASHSPATAAGFQRIVEAYDVLADPARRAAYDAAYWARYRAGAASAGLSSSPAVPPPPRQAPAPATSVTPRASPRPPGPRPSGQRSAAARSAPVAPTAPVVPRGPITPVAPIGAIAPVGAAARARRAAGIGRAAAAVRGKCEECGSTVVGGGDLCAACARKHGSFQEHLARAAARFRR